MVLYVYGWRWLYLFAKERQYKIYSMLKEKNAVTTSALVELFGVSIETVRRDLLEMEQNELGTAEIAKDSDVYNHPHISYNL